MLSRRVIDAFGDYRQYSSLDAWEGIEASTGQLPVEYKEFCSLYGPGIIGRFIKIFHPDSQVANMHDQISQMAPLYQELYPQKIPYEMYPFVADGAILWALSAQSDAFFLVPSGWGDWHIGVWYRQWAEWEEYSDDVPTWLTRQVVGELEIPGIPLKKYGGFSGLA
ncbi:hypothetical protein [Actinacidiphila epipremni]|uniref:SMI1/KNR4 family protein n=1 Tax=Actinacidiphila epipremni TaxID=2053013 RepID=A0ABX0ZF88_9ACTN|nr:hypothetical protein [Actinacidiphila epipremni]NJP42370.1 hypothetical protein [Actinacidiphila epipremni]